MTGSKSAESGVPLGEEEASTHPLPSGDLPVETHLNILRRFMSVSRNGAIPVEPLATEGQGIPPGASQANAPFLANLGLLVEEMPGRFKPTPVAMQLINTQIVDESRGRRLLRSLIEKTWFAAAAGPILSADPSKRLPEETILAPLRLAAGASSKRTDKALRVLVDYLTYCGLMAGTIQPPSTPGQGDAAGSTRPGSSKRRGRSAPTRGRAGGDDSRVIGPADAQVDWEFIRTSEFDLKIRPQPQAIQRLRKQLDLLAEKLEDSRAGRRTP